MQMRIERLHFCCTAFNSVAAAAFTSATLFPVNFPLQQLPSPVMFVADSDSAAVLNSTAAL